MPIRPERVRTLACPTRAWRKHAHFLPAICRLRMATWTHCGVGCGCVNALLITAKLKSVLILPEPLLHHPSPHLATLGVACSSQQAHNKCVAGTWSQTLNNWAAAVQAGGMSWRPWWASSACNCRARTRR